MSIVVDLAGLEHELSQHPTAYLLLVGEERPHVGEVEVRMEAGRVIITHAGRTARRVLGERPGVTLLLPPHEPDGYTLVVDGTATIAGDQIHVDPAHAVLHRRPRPASAAGSQGDGEPFS